MTTQWRLKSGIHKKTKDLGSISLRTSVETTLGTFEVVYGPRQQTRVRFGKRQTLFRNPGVQARLGGAGAAETGA